MGINSSTSSALSMRSHVDQSENVDDATPNNNLSANSSAHIFDYLKKVVSVVKCCLLYCLAKIAKFFSYIFFLPQETRDNLDKRCEEYLNKIASTLGKTGNTTQYDDAIFAQIFNTQSICTESPIFKAVQNKNFTEVEKLLQEDIDVSNMPGLIYLVIKAQDTNIMGRLLQSGMPCYTTFGKKKSIALKFAQRFENKKIVELIKAYTVPLEFRIFSAVQNNQYEALKFLLNKDNINTVDKNGNTPLFFAQTEYMVNYLLSLGADLNHTNKKGQTALFLFMKNKHNIRLLKASFKYQPNLVINNKKLFYALLLKNIKTPSSYTQEEKLLHIAVSLGSLFITKNLLQTHAYTQTFKNLMLYGAILLKNPKMVALLLENGANPTVLNTTTQLTLLGSAKKSKNPEIIQLLEIFAEPIENRLHKAVENNNKYAIDYFLKHIDINAVDKYGNTPAFYVQSEEILNYLLSIGADFNKPNKKRITALCQLAKHNDRLKLLAAYFKAKPNLDINKKELFYNLLLKNFYTPDIYNTAEKKLLYVALNIESLPVIKNLLKDHTYTEDFKNHMLYNAILLKNTKIVTLLLESGANPKAFNKKTNSTLLECATKSENEEIRQLSQIFTEDADSRLHKAVERDLNFAIAYLLKQNNVNSLDKLGNTPLYYVQNIETLKALLKANADFNIVNKNGETPQLSFARRKRLDLVEELLKITKNLNITNNKGESILHAAYQTESKDLFIALYHNILQKTNKKFTENEKDKFLDVVKEGSVKDIIDELANGFSINGLLMNDHDSIFYSQLIIQLFEEKDKNTDLKDALAKIKLFKNWLDIDFGLTIKDGQTLLHTIARTPWLIGILEEYIKYINLKNINKKDNIGKTALDYAITYSNKKHTSQLNANGKHVTDKESQGLRDANKKIIDILKLHGALESKELRK